MPTWNEEADQMGVLLDVLSGRGDGSIERSEAQGQCDLVASSDLPSETCPSQEEIAKHTGIQFHEPLNELFVRVTLPDGWSKRPTEHSMHTDLLDDKGRVRAGIFYKAAFYDRRADIGFLPRYSVRPHYEDDGTVSKILITDGGQPIKELPPAPDKKPYDQYEVGEAWLAEHYPDYENIWAYWD